MPYMNAGQLDHRNIGSHVTLPYLQKSDTGVSIAGALALVVKDADHVEILLAGDDEWLTLENDVTVEVSLPPAAAYTLHLKNALEELIVRLDKK